MDSESRPFPPFEYNEADRRETATPVSAHQELHARYRRGQAQVRIWLSDTIRDERDGEPWQLARTPTPHPLQLDSNAHSAERAGRIADGDSQGNSITGELDDEEDGDVESEQRFQRFQRFPAFDFTILKDPFVCLVAVLVWCTILILPPPVRDTVLTFTAAYIVSVIISLTQLY